MTYLAEKIEKFRRGVELFKKNRVDKPNLSANLDKMEVVIEFECYLEITPDHVQTARSTPSEPARELALDLSDISGFEGFQRSPLRAWRVVIDRYFHDWEESIHQYYIDTEREHYSESENYWLHMAKSELGDEWEALSETEREERANTMFENYLHRRDINDILTYFIDNDIPIVDVIDNSGLWRRLDSEYTHEGNRIYRPVEDNDDDDDSYSGSDRSQAFNAVGQRIREVYGDNVKVVVGLVDTQFKIDHPDWWFVESDGSLQEQRRDGRWGIEITSKHIPAKDALKEVNRFRNEVYRHFSGRTNNTTGMHVNVFTKGIIVNPEKLYLLMDEEHSLKEFGRENAGWAKPHKPGITHQLPSNPEDISKLSQDELLNAIQRGLDRSDKYRSVKLADYHFNDGSGRLEFRVIGHRYFGKEMPQAMDTMMKFIFLVAAACDDEAYKEDLMKKVDRFRKTAANVHTPAPSNIEKLLNDYYKLPFASKMSVSSSGSQFYKILNWIRDNYKHFRKSFASYSRIMEWLKFVNRYINIKKLADEDNQYKPIRILISGMVPKSPVLYHFYWIAARDFEEELLPSLVTILNTMNNNEFSEAMKFIERDYKKRLPKAIGDKLMELVDDNITDHQRLSHLERVIGKMTHESE